MFTVSYFYHGRWHARGFWFIEHALRYLSEHPFNMPVRINF